MNDVSTLLDNGATTHAPELFAALHSEPETRVTHEFPADWGHADV